MDPTITALSEGLESRALLTAGTGLLGQYFDAADLSGEPRTRLDSTIDFHWADSPIADVAANSFSVRWSGQVEAVRTERHSFIVNADEGARLWVNGVLLVDRFDESGVQNAAAQIDLLAGRRYDILLEYREHNGPASVRLEWSSASMPREVIPGERLFPSARGGITSLVFQEVRGSFITNLTGHTNFPNSPDDVDILPDFAMGNSSVDGFGQQIVGMLHATETGPHRFYIAANNDAELWLSNSENGANKRLIADVGSAVDPLHWTATASQQSDVIFLVAGQSYYIEAIYKDGSGTDHLQVGWATPQNQEITVIPGKLLSPVRPTVQLFAAVPNVSEGSRNSATVTFMRSGLPLNDPLEVKYSIRGTALNGVDYGHLSGNITIPANAESATLAIDPLTDDSVEGSESAIIEVVSDASYNVGLTSERTVHVTIQDDVATPTGGVSLWTTSHIHAFESFGGTFTAHTDADIGDIIQAEISSVPEDVYSAQLYKHIDSAVTKGDLLLAEFQIRSITGPGKVSAVFEESGGEYTKSLSQGVSVSTDWEKVQLPFVMADDFSAGEARFGFHLGQQKQTIQFGDFKLLNFGPPKAMATENGLQLYQADGQWGTAQTVPVSNQEFLTAYQVTTETVPSESWQIQTYQRNERAVASGQTMRVEFLARAATNTAHVEVMMQRTDTFAQFYTESMTLNSEWMAFSKDIIASQGFAPDELQIAFHLGAELQTVEIAELTWINLDHRFDVEDLPQQLPATSYGGRSGSDVWRSDAEERILATRRSNVAVNVTDVDGQPLNGAVVSLRQQNHEFRFGSAIDAFEGRLDSNGTDEAKKYQAEILRLFNSVVIENALKWPVFLQDRQRGIDAAQFARQNGMYLRGHNVIWPSREYMPEDVWAEYDNRVTNVGQAAAGEWLRTEINSRFTDISSTFEGVVDEWDVVNEPYSNRDVMNVLGDQIVTEWYRLMRTANPDSRLALNDYDIFAANGTNTAHRQDFDRWLNQLKDANLLDVIGEQSHYHEGNLTDIRTLGELIDTYSAEFNTPIAITEFDVDSRDEQLQADYLRDYLTMAFSNSGVSEFLHWGFWESAHYLPHAALYRSDFSVKPNGQVYEDLTFGRWWTDFRATTLDGTVKANVFLGDYEVVVEYDGQQYTSQVTVDSSNTSSVTVNLPIAGIDYDDGSSDLNPGNVDGDSDFDANDSYLIHIALLSGADTQIANAKGTSELSVQQIRENIERLGLQADVDGDQDMDANDSFLVHLVKLSGTDAQIDQFKGTSLLTAAEIRNNVDRLGSDTATQRKATRRNSQQRDLLLPNTSGDIIAISGHQTDSDSTSYIGFDAAWDDYRSWLDVI